MSKPKQKWLPKMVVVSTFDGEEFILDVGKDAVVTVTIKGPYVDLTYNDVRKLEVMTRNAEVEK